MYVYIANIKEEEFKEVIFKVYEVDLKKNTIYFNTK